MFSFSFIQILLLKLINFVSCFAWFLLALENPLSKVGWKISNSSRKQYYSVHTYVWTTDLNEYLPVKFGKSGKILNEILLIANNGFYDKELLIFSNWDNIFLSYRAWIVLHQKRSCISENRVLFVSYWIYLQ